MKKNSYLIIIFLFFLFWNIIISPLNLDEIWNYGFTNNLYLGLIPYKDFNLVIPPLYPFLMSIPFYLFGNNILVLHIENAILIILLIHLIKELIGKQVWFIIPLMIWPLNITYPNYNFFSLFLVVLILILEQKEKKETQIGLLNGFLILTKHTIGLPILFVSLFKTKEKKKRFIGTMIPIIIFLFYLLITKSFLRFIDYCILGLFDFNKQNGNYLNIVFFISIIFFILSIWMCIKDKKNDKYYYLIAFFSIVFPIFDYYHFLLYFLFFIIIFLQNHQELEKYSKGIGKVLLGIILFITITTFDYQKDLYPNKINHFEYRYLNQNMIENTIEVNQLIEKYHDKVIIIGPDSYYHKIIREKRINNLDLINTGNWGYQGTEKLLQEIKKQEKEKVFFLNKNEIGKNKQTDQEIIRYIKRKGKIIEKTKIYDIYQIK